MARLYLARRRGVGGFSRLVTLKLVHPHLIEDERIVKLFLDEARISAHVAHPNVVHVEEVGKFGDSYFIAMEYVHGVSLAELLARLTERRLRLRPKLCVWLAGQIAEALHAAHEAKGENGAPLGIVHRDVSPQNVLIGHTGHVKLIDFGIARSQSENDQKLGGSAVLGKLRYMSPEQLRVERADRRTDVYALGVMLWEMLAGRNLLRCQRLDDERDWQIRENPPPPSKYSAHSTPSLDRVVLRAIAYDSSERYDSAFQFRTALLRADPAAATLDAPMVAALMRSMLGDELDRRRASWPSEVSGELEDKMDPTSSHTWSLEELTSNNLGLFPMLEKRGDEGRAGEAYGFVDEGEDARESAGVGDEDDDDDEDGYAHAHGDEDEDENDDEDAHADADRDDDDYADISDDDDEAEPTVAIRSARPQLELLDTPSHTPMPASSHADMMLATSSTSMAEPMFASVRADLMLALSTAHVSYDPRAGLRVENAMLMVPSQMLSRVSEQTTVDMSVIDMPAIHAEAELLPLTAIDTLNCPPVPARPLEVLSPALAFRAAAIGSVCLVVGVLLGSLMSRTPEPESEVQHPPVEYVLSTAKRAAMGSLSLPAQPSAASATPAPVPTPEVDVTQARTAATGQSCADSRDTRILTGIHRDALSNLDSNGECRQPADLESARSARAARREARISGSHHGTARAPRHASSSNKRSTARKSKALGRSGD